MELPDRAGGSLLDHTQSLEVLDVSRPRPIISAVAAGCILLLATAAACDDEVTGPGNAPANHTVINDGVPHAPGLNDPTQNCTTCHGADLRGGPNGQPSCFSCHGQKWP